jgi:uncharacterized membrane protein
MRGSDTHRRERGQASILIIGGLICGLLALGMAFDGTRLLVARRDVSNIADAAALAGAGAVDQEAFRNSNGSVVQLDHDAAVKAAQSVDDHAVITVDARPDRVVVHVRRPVSLLVLRFLGLQHVGATAVGTPKVP